MMLSLTELAKLSVPFTCDNIYLYPVFCKVEIKTNKEIKQYQQIIVCFVNYAVSVSPLLSLSLSLSCNKQKLGYGTLKKGKS